MDGVGWHEMGWHEMGWCEMENKNTIELFKVSIFFSIDTLEVSQISYRGRSPPRSLIAQK